MMPTHGRAPVGVTQATELVREHVEEEVAHVAVRGRLRQTADERVAHVNVVGTVQRLELHGQTRLSAGDLVEAGGHGEAEEGAGIGVLGELVIAAAGNVERKQVEGLDREHTV